MRKTFKVSPREKGQRLLAFLREKCPNAPSVKALKRSIEGKLCRINGKIETFSTHILKTGDTVEIEIDLEGPVRFKPLLLWEDDVLAAYDKPAGVVCEPKVFPGRLIHRLDKETSGALLVAKNGKVLEQMIELFREKKVRKEYLAIVDGLVRDKTKTIISKLAQVHHFQGQTVYGSKSSGREAITEWELIGVGTKCSLLLCKPITGRTHQLRVHLKEAGHPIVGDYQYARVFQCPCKAKRHLLHAYKIRFPHPITQREVEVIAPVPLDFIEALEVVGMAHLLEL
ncbi:MAG TPA: RluA family pseudouridine synthase [Rhabdochlamydiaceae bacterium]|jgi:23S rRNA-/tRNA-specific pseudouridylate synthase|nr:RluA family pseudouridine synthase [Rhabdochlamydiaceae bacterium]